MRSFLHFRLYTLLACLTVLLVSAAFVSPIAASAQVAPIPRQSNWTMFGYNPQHTSVNAHEKVLNTKNVTKLQLDWSHKASNPIETSPAVVDGVLYAGSNDFKMYALNATTGHLRWSYTTGDMVNSYTVGGLIESASPTLAHGTVYVGAGVTLYALDEQTGALKWTYTTGDIGFGIYSAPAVLNGTLYLSVQDGNLYALDAQTGQLKWSYTTGDSIRASAVVVNGVVYVGSDDDTLYAFHLKA